ncbi:hypothetical protein BDQ12DRAFT_500463 [Crucibulum laeve]|uniref:Uncharacterized protein n=1 Tax=Crucibulum laeve TaxID=68775 RepID=A0A5C3LI75_9AGAR|nr:hypothetical protein BDQ12DRAFT_500463 [Crucibulum laeve]
MARLRENNSPTSVSSLHLLGIRACRMGRTMMCLCFRARCRSLVWGSYLRQYLVAITLPSRLSDWWVITLVSSAVGAKSVLLPLPRLPQPSSSTSSLSPSLSYSISTSTESSNSPSTRTNSTGDSSMASPSTPHTSTGDIPVNAQSLHQ